jgi:hypothetical protein
MTFEEILDQAIAMLRRRGRLTYGTLKRQFQLDDVEAELIYQRGLPPGTTYTFKHALIHDTAYECPFEYEALSCGKNRKCTGMLSETTYQKSQRSSKHETMALLARLSWGSDGL